MRIRRLSRFSENRATAAEKPKLEIFFNAFQKKSTSSHAFPRVPTRSEKIMTPEINDTPES
jgi:hypothetical protein